MLFMFIYEKYNFKSTLKNVKNDRTAQPVAKQLKINGDCTLNMLSPPES